MDLPRVFKDAEIIALDIDMTMLNTAQKQIHAINNILSTYGRKDISEDQFMKEVIYLNVEKRIQYLKQNFNLTEEAGSLEEMYVQSVLENADKNEVYEGVSELLYDLSDKKIALITGAPREEANPNIARIKNELIKDLDWVTVTESDVKNPKPHQESLEKAIEILGASYDSNIISIGDSPKDMGMGKNYKNAHPESTVTGIYLETVKPVSKLDTSILPSNFYYAKNIADIENIKQLNI